MKKIFQSFRTDTLKIVVNSFGFGKGLPMESDLVLDVRFLPNPYFVEKLKTKDGRNRERRGFCPFPRYDPKILGKD